MSGRETKGDDAWPIDLLFNQLFQKGQDTHPLRHMAWCDWCTHASLATQQAYLDGDALPYAGPEAVCHAIQEKLIWRYLYPSPVVLRDLIQTLTRMLVTFGEDWSSVINEIEYFKDKDRLRSIVPEFGEKGRGLFLAEVLQSMPFGSVFTKHPGGQQGDGKEEAFTTFQDLHDRLDLFDWGVPQTDHYDRAVAEGLLGSPEQGWRASSLVATLMRPLKTLFMDAARFSKNQLTASLGRMSAQIESFSLQQGPTLHKALRRQFGAAHFCFTVDHNNPVRDHWKSTTLNRKALLKTGFIESHPELVPRKGRPIDSTWFRLWALSGYDNAMYLMPAVRVLGDEYAKNGPKVSPTSLWDYLGPANEHAVNPLNSGVFTDAVNPPKIFRRLFDYIEASVKTELTVRAGQEATAPVEMTRATVTKAEMQFVAPSPRKRKRGRSPVRSPEDEKDPGYTADVGQFERHHGVWKPFDDHLQETGERLVVPAASDKDNTLLYVGGAALLALLVMAR